MAKTPGIATLFGVSDGFRNGEDLFRTSNGYEEDTVVIVDNEIIATYRPLIDRSEF